MYIQSSLELVCMFFKNYLLNQNPTEFHYGTIFLLSQKSRLSPRNVSAQGYFLIIQFIAYNHN